MHQFHTTEHFILIKRKTTFSDVACLYFVAYTRVLGFYCKQENFMRLLAI